MSLIKTESQIEKIRESGKILGSVLRELKNVAKVGVTLLELDKIAYDLIKAKGGKPAFLGYKPDGAIKKFPYTLCASVNDTIVHGLPSAYKLVSGDVLKLDLGVDWQGGITDAAVTVPIGKVGKDTLSLIKATREALIEAIRVVKDGHTLGDIGYAITRTVERSNFKVVEGLTGHGVGNKVHEDPIIYNYGEPGKGELLRAGMVIAIEPMTSISTKKIVQLPDDSFVTADGSLSAHFEHTMLVTLKGAEVLTE
ncbi:MAG TPA: type I methionyl aminopeptidase [Candidatus Paceibacterota bacterium]|nr:type I methionyl aminopeptidase [Candidatus Paceibacterota bacterium]